MKSISITMCIALVLGAMAPGYALAQQSLAAPAARISETTIGRDHAAYSAMQARIKALNDGGRLVADYHLSKAQCWLDTSFHEYTRNDRGGYPQAALGEAGRIVSALEAGTDPGMETPLLNGAEKLRPDLWVTHDALKRSAGFKCAAQATACAEVELVHAGNEMHDGGWRHANPYVQIAESLTARAEAAAKACPAAARTTEAPAPAPVHYEMAGDALFAFDRGDLAGLLPGGQGLLDALAVTLRERASLKAVDITGHTDRLGSTTHNLALSRRRAETVKAYLQKQGVTAPIFTRGVAASQPSGKTEHCTGGVSSTQLRACLQPDRRVQIDLSDR